MECKHKFNLIVQVGGSHLFQCLGCDLYFRGQFYGGRTDCKHKNVQLMRKRSQPDTIRYGRCLDCQQGVFPIWDFLEDETPKRLQLDPCMHGTIKIDRGMHGRGTYNKPKCQECMSSLSIRKLEVCDAKFLLESRDKSRDRIQP